MTIAMKDIRWMLVIEMIAIHLLGIAALVYFASCVGFAMFAVLFFLTGWMGICVGFHRLLTHNSFKTYYWVRWIFAMLGSLAAQGPPLFWVGTHRKHHKYSDQPGDPHSPTEGLFWAHCGWVFPVLCKEDMRELQEFYAKDLWKDPVMRWINAHYRLWLFLSFLAIAGFGYAVGGWWMATSCLLWGFCARIAFFLEATWLVNSAAHKCGYRSHNTKDHSRNNWWVALITGGEGWHNNHHQKQQAANHGRHALKEPDVAYWSILLLAKLRLAWSIKKAEAMR